MQKIMFNDRFLLTKAVLEGRKTQTRRLATTSRKVKVKDINGRTLYGVIPQYKTGEIVAIAQSYQTTFAEAHIDMGIIENRIKSHKGWTNKMYVKPCNMPHQILITGIRSERLQDISDEDCLKEGIEKFNTFGEPASYIFTDNKRNIHPKGWCTSPREAYAELIDKISGKGTWEKNPYVFVYDFELIK